MKKYIRRANGVYELKINEQAKKENVVNYFYTRDNELKCNLLFDKEDLKQFKQADTIEELCDEFVAFKNNEDYGILSAKDYLASSRWEMEDSAKNGYQIYGAIWTDKGLIYVAKMNEEGDLELI